MSVPIQVVAATGLVKLVTFTVTWKGVPLFIVAVHPFTLVATTINDVVDVKLPVENNRLLALGAVCGAPTLLLSAAFFN